MKKILLLGGSAQQIVAIKKAKELGFYTILCDYLPDNPGQYVADKFYQTSTTDFEAILNVAKENDIDGIVAYASDPAAPTAAYVAEKLNLPTNPFKSVEVLCNKDKFRKFLMKNNFDYPHSYSFANCVGDFKPNHFPVIIKPVDSSGSKGVTVLENLDGYEKAVQYALSYSRKKTIIIEDFLVKDHPYLIGGDIFVVDGEIVLYGLLNCHRDSNVNPLVPVGKSYPLLLNKSQEELVKLTLSKLVHKLDIKFGAMNVEAIITKDNKCYLVDAGPRAGGNMIPLLINKIFGFDEVHMTISLAMGVSSEYQVNEQDVYYATHNLHSDKNGTLNKIVFDEKLEKFIVEKHLYVKENDLIQYFDDASKALGIIFMKFNSKEEQDSVLANINNLYHVELK